LLAWLLLQLDNWSSGSSTKLEIKLPVPAGQLDLAQLLVKGMYQAQPTVAEELSHSQLLQLLLLADRFEVPKVQAAVLAVFTAIQAEQLEWKTALVLLDLPFSCAQQPEFAGIQQLAVQRLQQQVGDLELAWNDEQSKQQLLQLPFCALLQLLQHNQTRVASENTVVFTVQQWYQQQPARQRQQGQLQQLLQEVRIRHCTPYYVSTVMTQCPLVSSCFSTLELGLARECCTADGFEDLQEGRSPVLQQYPAWSADKRPASGMQQQVVWRLPLSELQAAVKKHLDDPDPEAASAVVNTRSCLLQGQHCRVYVRCGSSGRPAVLPGRWVRVQLALLLTKGAVRRVRFQVTAEAATPAGEHIVRGPDTAVFASTAITCEPYMGYVITKLDGSSWQQIEQDLRQQQLVHAAGGGCDEPHLLLKVEILEMS
jgi:hypothetical protein